MIEVSCPAQLLIPKQPLDHLAGRRPGQLGNEVNGARALEMGEPVPAEVDQLLREVRAGSRRFGELDNGLDFGPADGAL